MKAANYKYEMIHMPYRTNGKFPGIICRLNARKYSYWVKCEFNNIKETFTRNLNEESKMFFAKCIDISREIKHIVER